MKFKIYLPKLLYFLIFLFLINILTVSVGDDVSSITVVNKTSFLIDVYIESATYSSIIPNDAIIHTTNPKRSVEVTAKYTEGQQISGSVTRTVELPYTASDEACRCEEGNNPDCIYVPEQGGSSRWEVRPADFSGTTSAKGTIWINDQLKAENVDLVAPDNYNDFCLLGTNWSGSGSSIVYFDDIKVFSYPSPQFEDNFESYVTGSYPAGNWVTRFSGQSGTISDAVAISGSKSFELISLATWARVEAYALPSYADSIIYEGYVYVNQAGRGAQIGFGEKVSSNEYKSYNVVTFGNDNAIHFNGADTTLQFESWAPQTWYKVKVKCNFITAAKLNL